MVARSAFYVGSESSFVRMGIVVWCSSLGVLSFLLFPSIQGTVPAYLFAISSVPLCLAFLKETNAQELGSYIRDWFLLGCFWVFFFVASQSEHYLTGAGLIKGFNYISGDNSMLVRTSMLTQSVYLLACFATFTFFRHWRFEKLEEHIFKAAWVVAAYGIYEWLYFLVFGRSGDFVVNRVFEGVDGIPHTASWSQSVIVAGLDLLRIKSTLGEPSFFSTVAVPFLFAAFLTKRWRLTVALLFCVIFTWSTSAYAGVFLGLVLLFCFGGASRGASIAILGLAVLAMMGFYVFMPDVFQSMIVDKLTGMNDSGAIRMDLEELQNKGLSELSIWSRMFGIGFGYVYGSVWQACILNLGWIGSALFAAFFVTPLLACSAMRKFTIWGLCSVVILVLYIVNVAELYLPTTWAFLGLAWKDLDVVKANMRSKNK